MITSDATSDYNDSGGPLAVAADVADLVERATKRDRDAFGELYNLYLDRVFRHIYYLVGNPQEAEDITAQAFMQAWKAIDRYRATGAPFVTWLIRIAHNLAISYHRRHRHRLLALDEAVAAADGHSAPDRVYQTLEEHEQLMQALQYLKEPQRQVIILRFIDDLDYPAVAAMMGKSVAAVRVIQHRALVSLRRILETEAGAGPPTNDAKIVPRKIVQHPRVSVKIQTRS